MDDDIEQTASAFSTHRFTEVSDRLADDVRWHAVGGPTLLGRPAVVQACEQTSQDLAGTTTTFRRLLVVVGTDAVAVDTIAEYVDPSGATSVVSSCDVYEFSGGRVQTITSYAVELDAE